MDEKEIQQLKAAFKKESTWIIFFLGFLAYNYFLVVTIISLLRKG